MAKTQDYSQIVSELYDMDAWYATYDYEQNTKRIMMFLDNASNKSLLELASGTGSYLNTFSRYYKNVAGLELSTYMRDISLKKYPQLPVYLENMADFSINQSFDVMVLLCGSIAELTQDTEVDSLKMLRDMICCCKNHLNPKGIIIIETYDQPDTIKEWVDSQHYIFEDKYVSYNSVKVIKNKNFSKMTKHFLISPKIPSGKTEYIKEVCETYLCTIEKLISLFKEQGFEIKMQIPSFAIEGRDLLIFK
jgi:SAM-dependent methyltransferase